MDTAGTGALPGEPQRRRGHPDEVFDYTLYHAVPGAWRSVAHMRAALSNIEWLEHAAFLRLRADQQDEAMKKAQRRQAARRGR